jgi:hypothetical protein
MIAAVMRDHFIAVLHVKQHLRIPGIGVKRPTVREYDDLARTPVFIEDTRAVFFRDIFRSACEERRVECVRAVPGAAASIAMDAA